MSATELAFLQTYRQRRERVVQWLRAAGGGIAIVPTAPEAMRNRDSDYPYRHDSYFYYLTDLTEPEAVFAVVIPVGGAPARGVLFCRPKHEEREIWDGFRFGSEAAKDAFGLDEAHSVEEVDATLPKLLANATVVACPLAESSAFDRRMRHWLDAVRMQGRAGVPSSYQALDVRATLDEMRLFKDASELDIMRRAGRIPAGTHMRTMQASRAGLCEYHLEAELLYEFRRHDAQSVAYNSIAATGPNACVLYHRAGNAELHDGDLCLIDAGCELDGYASDITRTFPVNGCSTDPQCELYAPVIAVQEAVLVETRPGVPYNVSHDVVAYVLARDMLDTGLLDAGEVGTLDDMTAGGQCHQLYMHRTDHWLDMDVHDVDEYRTPNIVAPAEGEHPWRPLEAGVMLTVELGIYVRPAPGVPEQYWRIDIHIEGDTIVTSEGCEIVTRNVPVAPDEIELVMRGQA